MGIYIKDMKMPKSCDKCQLIKSCDRWVAELQKDECGMWMPVYPIPKDCPLVEVKTPHGRLGDLDKALQECFAVEDISLEPTVIEAEAE